MDRRNIYIGVGAVIVLVLLAYSFGWFGGRAPEPVATVPTPAPAATVPAPSPGAPATPAPATPAPAAPAQ